MKTIQVSPIPLKSQVSQGLAHITVVLIFTEGHVPYVALAAGTSTPLFVNHLSHQHLCLTAYETNTLRLKKGGVLL